MEKEYINPEKLIRTISSITLAIYIVIAIILILLAVISLYVVGVSIISLLFTPAMTGGILQVLHALLVTIIIIEVLETVVVYFRIGRLQVKPIIIAGLTAMIRRVLLFGVETTNTGDIALTLAAVVVLTIAIVFIGREESER
jgi:uncharacterized membrane protein (DUF373 family)